MKIRLLQLSAALLVVSALNAQVVTIGSVAEHSNYYNGDKPMVTMYTATWCGPCKATKPHFRALARENADVVFCLVDIDNTKTKPLTKGIRGVPTFIVSHKGKNIARQSSGMSKTELRNFITRAHSKVAQKPAATQCPAQAKA